MQESAKQKEGSCLSPIYIDVHTKLKWQCKEGHTWDAMPSAIRHGYWCSTCAHMCLGMKRRDTIEEMQEIAKLRGGECLSKSYTNNLTKLKWRCKVGHDWEATPSSIKHFKSWCPICFSHVSETICRQYFEAIFGEKFPKVRPAWLVGSKGRTLEIDGYCKKLNLAFEYNGKQHYDEIASRFFKRGLNEQQAVDEIKRKACKEHRVVLIEVPHTVSYESMGEFILEECAKLKVDVPAAPSKRIDYKDFDYSQDRLDQFKKIAIEKEGRCLSQKYINSTTKLKFICKAGHEWMAIPTQLTQGHWCRECSGYAKGSIEQMREFAASKNGECLSEEYVDSKTKLKWRCAKGHDWNAAPSHIISNQSWCPICSHKKKLTIEEMQSIAHSRGGECLSEEYVNNQTHLQWRCILGHEWPAKPTHIKDGHWCPTCSYKQIWKTRRINAMKQINMEVLA